MATINDKMTAIANAIRTKTGKTAKLNLDTMASDLNAIAERTSSNLTASGATVTVPAGNYKTQATKSVATATQATPSISVNSSGLITASATQTAGYVSAGTKSGTKQLTTKAAATITPGTSNKTIAAGTYLTGVQTIAGDADLKASNIKKGVNIFGVAGSYEGVSSTLNLKVVGSTSAPANPTENTIWVNTSTAISGYYLSATEPENMQSGEVWIRIGTYSDVAFNADNDNTVMIYPLIVKQMVSGNLVPCAAKIWQNGSWVQFAFERFYFFKEGMGVDDGYEFKGIDNSVAGGSRIDNDKITMCSAAIPNGLVNAIWIEPKVDLQSYERLCVELTCTGRYDYTSKVTIGVGSDVPAYSTVIGLLDASVEATYDTTAGSVRKTYEVPVNSVPYERYIKILVYGVTGYIYNIWLE